ncbi:hypothetical protein [Lysobacter enzymogenes]|uniref:hypothetical protein n=1 Tax=Lysobacter enzymogenes TaxID=69 RepID=UPI001AF4363F|nr:hypothetical protein [Lysobacter enzymogenes]QQQ00712.1 hypothetical protein JHW41_21980 [Lysobacter enzymogenes]
MKRNAIGWTALAMLMFGMGFGASATVPDPQECLDSCNFWFDQCLLEGDPSKTCAKENVACIRTCLLLSSQGG